MDNGTLIMECYEDEARYMSEMGARTMVTKFYAIRTSANMYKLPTYSPFLRTHREPNTMSRKTLFPGEHMTHVTFGISMRFLLACSLSSLNCGSIAIFS